MIRKTGKYAVALLVLLVGWIAINSIDDPPRYDQSLLLPDIKIPDEQNGFAVLRHLDKDYDKDVLINNKDYQQLRKIVVEWKAWDSQFSERLLAQNNPLLDQIPELITRPYFKLATTYSAYQYTPHGRLFQVARLNLLKSRAALENGDIDNAINTAHTTLLFCEKISAEKNGNMLSYMIGKTCVGSVLDFYHAIASSHELSKDQYKTINASIDSIAPYGNDGFDQIIRGEFTAIARMANTQHTQGIAARWSDYTEYLQQLKKNNTAKEYIPSTVDKIYTYLSMLFPDYYFHVNRLLNNISPATRDAITFSQHYCDASIKSSPDSKSSSTVFSGRTLTDFFLPDSLGAAWQFSLYPLAGFDGYLIRRCQKYNYFSAVKISIAVKHYQQDHGKPPSTLETLIPDYLQSIPLDYFSGNPLQYSAARQWLYSEGVGHDNRDGATIGFYKITCRPQENNPRNECNTKPTFPINWNDYKFYEVLHKAEAGDANSQNEIGWMYQYGKYTSIDTRKAIEWYSRAAAQNNSNAARHLGDIYAENHSPFHDDTKAMAWYKKCHEQGCVSGSTGYANYLLSGDAGITDFSQAAEIFIGLAHKNSSHYGWSWLNALNYNTHGINTDITTAAWLYYFIHHPYPVKTYGHDPKDSIPELHRRLGYYYRWEARNHVPDNATPDAYNNLLNLALDHYRQAGDAENVRELEKETKQGTSTSPIQKNQPDPLVCKALKQGNTDLLAMQKTQTQIFRNPDKANSLAMLFHNALNTRYPVSSEGNQAGDTLGVSFESIELGNIAKLYFDFMYGDKAPSFEFAPGAEKLLILARLTDQPALPSLSLLLASYGVSVECRADSIYFSITNPERAKPHIFSPHFITQWDPGLYDGTTLTGTGHISYEDTFHYRGEIANALPNGAGTYSDSGNTKPEHYFRGDHFVDGVLYGHGVRVRDGLVIQEGRFDAYSPVFPNVVGYGSSCDVLPEIKHGTATETHYDCTDSKYRQYYHMPVHSTLPPLWKYYGEYHDGKKTTGTCTVYKDAKPADTFHCTFYNNSLIKVDDVSLLPPGMTTAELRQYH